MDLTPLFTVDRAMESPLLFLIRGLLTAIPTISTVSLIGRVDLTIVLLLV
jgi:hypothetical protein